MGSAGDPGPAAKAGKFIAACRCERTPRRPVLFWINCPSVPTTKGSKPRTKFDWLSRDGQEVQKYLDDPHCGMVCSSGFFFDLLTGLQMIHDPKLIEGIPKNLPILVISGEADPVGKYGQGIRQFVGQMKNHNINNIDLKLYPEARHELLNEINRDEVMQDIAEWLHKRLPEA